jgi:hypothetical protein
LIIKPRSDGPNMSNDPLEKELERLEAQGSRFVSLPDANVLPALIVLTKAVLRLDSTSSLLWKVNIALTGVVIVLTIVQLIVTFFHH